jgi:8-oxo-dGTP pyrophosphatase MutT (NUDIX family)
VLRDCSILPTFRKLTERTVHEGRRITVAVATYEAPDGERFERDLVHHPGAVSCVPVDDEGNVLLVRQYRAPIDKDMLEIPAGLRDVPDEPPEETAHRELEEEVGMKAARMEKLCEFYNSAGFCDELSFVFLARGLTPSETSFQGIEEQHMTVERIRLADAPRLIAEGEIVDAKTIIGLALARERLAGE